MKKVLLIVVLAAMTLMASAQSAGLKTFDGKLFSCLYPAEFEAEEQWTDDVFNAYVKDTPCHFNLGISADVVFSDADIKSWGEDTANSTKEFMTGWKVEPCVVKGKSVYVISEGKEDNVPSVQVQYLVNTPSKHVFSGRFLFLKKDEAKYRPLIEEILASFKAKK